MQMGHESQPRAPRPRGERKGRSAGGACPRSAPPGARTKSTAKGHVGPRAVRKNIGQYTKRMRAFAVALSCFAILACRSEPPPPPAEAPPAARNLLLITIDTLRADRIGAYGYDTARTPAMDALAAQGVRFAHA